MIWPSPLHVSCKRKLTWDAGQWVAARRVTARRSLRKEQKNVWQRTARWPQLLAQGTPAALSTAAQGMPLQGALARERRQAELLKQRQRAEQRVAGKRELQQKKQNRWQWDRLEPLEHSS